MNTKTNSIILLSLLFLVATLCCLFNLPNKVKEPAPVKKMYINYYYEGRVLIKTYFSYKPPYYTFQSGHIQIIDTNGIEVILLNGRVESKLFSK